MDLGEQYYRYAIRLIVLIIVGRAGYLIFRRIKEGKKPEIVVILLRMWRDETEFQWST